jgi:hypothetical protein
MFAGREGRKLAVAANSKAKMQKEKETYERVISDHVLVSIS